MCRFSVGRNVHDSARPARARGLAIEPQQASKIALVIRISETPVTIAGSSDSGSLPLAMTRSAFGPGLQPDRSTAETASGKTSGGNASGHSAGKDEALSGLAGERSLASSSCRPLFGSGVLVAATADSWPPPPARSGFVAPAPRRSGPWPRVRARHRGRCASGLPSFFSKSLVRASCGSAKSPAQRQG